MDYTRITAYVAAEKLTPLLVETLLCGKARSDNIVDKAKKHVKDGQDKAHESTKDALEKIKEALKTLADTVGGSLVQWELPSARSALPAVY